MTIFAASDRVNTFGFHSPNEKLIPALGGNASSAAASAAVQAAAMSGNIKSKDEVSFEYHLNKPDGSPAIASTTLKRKAQKDGDDVLSPLIDEAVNGVINSLKTK